MVPYINPAYHTPGAQNGCTLRTISNIFMTCWLSVERSLPIGLLVQSCLEICNCNLVTTGVEISDRLNIFYCPFLGCKRVGLQEIEISDIETRLITQLLCYNAVNCLVDSCRFNPHFHKKLLKKTLLLFRSLLYVFWQYTHVI